MDYTASRKSTAEKLRKAGKLVTIRTPGEASYNEETGINTPGTPVDTPAYAMEQSQNALTLWSSTVDNALVQDGDRFFMLAALDANGAVLARPTPAATFFIGAPADGVQLAIKGVRALEPGPVAIYYEVQCRG